MGFHRQLLLMGVGYAMCSQAMAWAQEPSSQEAIESQLSHKVEVLRQGRRLILHYELVDSTGQAQDLSRIIPEAPRFAIYQGERKLATGEFEFG
jgi:hypothetical protein